MTKIYLSKSNNGHPDALAAVRHRLKELKFDVVEYNGGTYSHADMISCDYLLVIPPDLSEHEYVGKGQHEQISTFKDYKTERTFILEFDKSYTNRLWIYKVRSSNVYDETDWKFKHAIVYTQAIPTADLSLDDGSYLDMNIDVSFLLPKSEDKDSVSTPKSIDTKAPKPLDSETIKPMLACVKLLKQ